VRILSDGAHLEHQGRGLVDRAPRGKACGSLHRVILLRGAPREVVLS
jgi:hypothetical protein